MERTARLSIWLRTVWGSQPGTLQGGWVPCCGMSRPPPRRACGHPSGYPDCCSVPDQTQWCSSPRVAAGTHPSCKDPVKPIQILRASEEPVEPLGWAPLELTDSAQLRRKMPVKHLRELRRSSMGASLCGQRLEGTQHVGLGRPPVKHEGIDHTDEGQDACGLGCPMVKPPATRCWKVQGLEATYCSRKKDPRSCA